MIAQLTHLRPRPGCCEKLIDLLRDIARQTGNGEDQPSYAMMTRLGDHLFVVARYPSQEVYDRAIAANTALYNSMADLLVDNHGPTYTTDVIEEFGTISAADRVGDNLVPNGIFMPGASS